MSDDSPRGARSHWPLAIAVIAVAVVVLAGFVVKRLFDQPGRLADTVGNATQPRITINTIIQTSLERLREESKLVVYTANVAVMVTKLSDKKVLYGKVDLGTSTVRLRAAGNKAQLIVPFRDLGSEDFQFDESSNTLTVTLPNPRVDETLVEVQTDPTFYEIETDLGWARLDKFSGEFLRDQARRDLRPAVIAEASHPRIIELARESAETQVSALLETAVKPLRPEAVVKVEFREPVPEL